MTRKYRNKTIGIIGGVGPQASRYLYDKIMDLAQKKYKAKNNDDFPELILYSIPVPDFISNKNNIPKAMRMFKKVIVDLNKVQVDYIVIVSNTVHLLIDEFRKLSSIEFISMIETVVNKVKADKRKRIGLLASPVAIRSGLYKKLLTKENIDLIYPEEKDQERVEEMIRAVIAGTNNGSLKKEYIKIIQKLFDRGTEAIILGCTELPLAINYEAINNRVYNSVDILAEKIVDVYFEH